MPVAAAAVADVFVFVFAVVVAVVVVVVVGYDPISPDNKRHRTLSDAACFSHRNVPAATAGRSTAADGGHSPPWSGWLRRHPP